MGEVTAAGARRPSILPLVIAVLLLPAVLGSSLTIFNDGDVSWHIATGQWILDHRAIPHVDPFSYTWAGKPWVPMEWLADVAFGWAYRLDGYAGVSALVTAAIVALHGIVYFNARKSLGPYWPLALLIAMDAVAIAMLLARPHVLTWPLLAFWLWLMLRAREQDRAPPLAAALLMALWANLHGSFLFGLVIAAAFGLEALVAAPDKPRALRQWLIFGAACGVAVLFNGNGLEGIIYPLSFSKLQMLPLIDEWKPSSPAKTPLFFAVLAIALALIAWRRPRLHWVRWLLLGGLLGLALLQARHQAMLAIVAAMLLPEALAKGAKARPAASSAWMVACGGALLVALRAIMPMGPPDNEANPWKLIAAVPAELRSQPVLNGYSMGGPLILSGIRPYIDGRSDMYGDALVLGFARISHGDDRALADAVSHWNIRWAIVPNSSRRFIALMDRSPGWHAIKRDRVGTIYVRDSV